MFASILKMYHCLYHYIIVFHYYIIISLLYHYYFIIISLLPWYLIFIIHDISWLSRYPGGSDRRKKPRIYGAWQRLHCALKAIARPWDADFLNEKMEGENNGDRMTGQKNRLKNHVVYWFEDVRTCYMFSKENRTPRWRGKQGTWNKKQLIKIYYHCSMSSEAAKRSV